MTTTAPPLPEPVLEGIDYELWGQNAKTDCYSPEQMKKRDAYWLERLRAAEADAQECATVLMELVALKDLKDQFSPLRSIAAKGDQTSIDEARKRAQMASEYNRRKPLAWAAARALRDRLEKI